MPKTKNKLSENSEYKSIYFSLSKTFMEKKLRVNLTFNGYFSTTKYQSESIGAGYFTRSSSDMSNNRGIGLGISYRFNDFSERNDRNIDDGRDASSRGSGSN
jgi:hypothetical protein